VRNDGALFGVLPPALERLAGRRKAIVHDSSPSRREISPDDAAG